MSSTMRKSSPWNWRSDPERCSPTPVSHVGSAAPLSPRTAVLKVPDMKKQPISSEVHNYKSLDSTWTLAYYSHVLCDNWPRCVYIQVSDYPNLCISTGILQCINFYAVMVLPPRPLLLAWGLTYSRLESCWMWHCAATPRFWTRNCHRHLPTKIQCNIIV